MESQSRTFAHAGAMPAPTWHFLKMNDVEVEIPEGLVVESHVKLRMPAEAIGPSDAFERAIAAAQVEWAVFHPELSDEELAEREAHLAAEADATYGGIAQSTYQAEADAMEAARSLEAAFAHGMGDDVASYMRSVAAGAATGAAKDGAVTSGELIVVAAEAGSTVFAQVVVDAVPDTISVAAIDVVAGEGSSVTLSIVVDGPVRGVGVPRPSETGTGFAGTTLRVFADKGSHVRVERTQTLGDGFTDIDDVGLFVHERARVEVRQTVLGAAHSFTGLAGDLRGDSACVDVETRYLGRGEQTRDFNYILRHHGTRTRCNLNANGVLSGRSQKTLRGTIDLIKGAKGAEGKESETVLLTDDGVRNKTVPVILCNEDDVVGSHGATIGHIRSDQLFYLATRGLSREAAEQMFASAIVEQAAYDAPDDVSRAAVIRLGDRLSPGFAELLDM